MIGLDLAKNVFQIHAVDEAGQAVQKKRLTRGGLEKFFAGLARCRIGMEACAGSHHWARTLIGLGHEVRILPPQYVRPYVKTNKNDAADAAAICEAMQRPEMRFVPVKSVAQQALLVLHRSRELLGRQRVMTINALRGHCAEFGVVVAQGPRHVPELLARLDAPGDDALPELVKQTLRTLAAQLRAIEANLAETDKALLAEHRRQAPPAGAWRRSRGSARSRPARSSPASAMPSSSHRDVISRRGSGWCHDNIPRAERPGSGRSASAAMPICAGC